MNKTLKTLLVSLIAGTLTFLLSLSGLFNRIDYALTDALYQRPEVVDNRIKIIAIDEKSLDEYGPLNTWDRSYYAKLLDVLYDDESYAPDLTVFDVIFQGNVSPEGDEALAQAAERAGDIVCATNISFKPTVEVLDNGKLQVDELHIELIEYPYSALKENVFSGYADSIQDSRDGRIREFYPYLEYDGEAIPSLAMETALRLNEKGLLNIEIPSTEPEEKLILKYTGKPGDYEKVSFVDVCEGNIPKEAFKNSIVLVGAYAPGMLDAYSVPTDYSTQMYGVEIHANIIDAINNGRYMTRVNNITLSAIYAVVVMLFMLIAQLIPVLWTSIAGVVIIAVGGSIGTVLSHNHKFVPLATLVIMVVASGLASFGIEYLKTLRQRRKVLKAFKQYVAPQIVEEIAKKGDYELKLGGEKRDIAVLFVDIRGFTPLSESLEPEQVVAILNEYLSLTTKSIFDNMGTLDKFVGDATMAVFNSPFELDDYVYRAVCTARDIVEGGEEIRRKAFELTGKEVGFGIGVNCGDAVVGNIGCDFRMDYTAIGDTVNTAARLEANAKTSQVLLSQNVVDRLKDRIEVKPVGEIPLKGKSIPLMVYELVRIL